MPQESRQRIVTAAAAKTVAHSAERSEKTAHCIRHDAEWATLLSVGHLTCCGSLALPFNIEKKLKLELNVIPLLCWTRRARNDRSNKMKTYSTFTRRPIMNHAAPMFGVLFSEIYCFQYSEEMQAKINTITFYLLRILILNEYIEYLVWMRSSSARDTRMDESILRKR